MTADPLDTRVTNGRFAGPGAPADGILTIHNGVVVDQPEATVWRTVNASGHLVFPGLIQPSGVGVSDALGPVRGGVTTALSSAPESGSACLDFLDLMPTGITTIQPDAEGVLAESDWQALLSRAAIHFQAPLGSDFPVIHFLYHEGHVKRGMSLERIAAVTSGNLSKALAGDPVKGSFRAGSSGDLFVFDPDSDDTYSDLPWPGRVIFSLMRGAILLFNGQIHTNPGDGKRVS